MRISDWSSDVCSSDLAVDGAAHGAELGFRLVAARIADHDRLAAAIGKPRKRRLVGHAARKTQHVGQRPGPAGIRPPAAAAEGGAAARVVTGGDGLQAATGIGAEDDLPRAVAFTVPENGTD